MSPEEKVAQRHPVGFLARILMRWRDGKYAASAFSVISFSYIGSLGQIDDFTWEVTYRPLSMPMNELVRVGSLPRDFFTKLDTTFDIASSYFESLAELHILRLIDQKNDAIESADDCRRKFVARYLFRKLARERKLTERWASFDEGPFKLWCDDFRPANVLLNKDLKTAGVVDCELTYAAPVEFSYAPPWWLLIEKPECWPTDGGLED
ncbi:Aminoglycoside phosphotransferase [Penicillium fimorum]|uniref:Aminoglycoside phosphotransferase n=1 Tax=Penicillium fimorum TaxID=1882269 RepID=A0A9W9XQ41_9EURO|nr:Aminoglycoside phosphotransferase [Penicillium fimorum]